MKMKLLKNIHFVSYTDDDLVKKNRKACSKKLSFENHFYLEYRIYQLLTS